MTMKTKLQPKTRNVNTTTDKQVTVIFYVHIQGTKVKAFKFKVLDSQYLVQNVGPEILLKNNHRVIFEVPTSRVIAVEIINKTTT